MRHPKVSIIIVNWNGKQYLKDCLTSVSNQTYPSYEVIFVDNASSDGSVEYVEEKFPKVQIIVNKENLGFAEGNNVGIRVAKGIYIVTLNNDTKVDKNWLNELIKVAETENNKVGMYAPKMLKMANPKIIDSTGHVFKWEKIIDRGRDEFDKGQYNNKLDIVGGCAGACLYRRDMLEEVGLFDENFWMYYEDAELSWRAYKRGWKAKYVPSAIVYHKGGGTTKKSKELEREMAFLCARNMVRTVKRHATPLQKFLFILVFTKTAVMSWIGMRIGRNVIGAKPYINAFREFLK